MYAAFSGVVADSGPLLSSGQYISGTYAAFSGRQRAKAVSYETRQYTSAIYAAFSGRRCQFLASPGQRLRLISKFVRNFQLRQACRASARRNPSPAVRPEPC